MGAGPPSDGGRDLPDGSGRLTEALRRIRLAARLRAHRLDLRGLGLTRLPPQSDWPTGWPGPRRLDLSGNALDTWPEGLQTWPAIEWLDLGDNRLEALDGRIGLLTALQHLGLRGNRLRTLPAALARCQALTALDLRANAIQAWPEVLDRLPCLREVAIGDNPLPAEAVPLRLPSGVDPAAPAADAPRAPLSLEQRRQLAEAAAAAIRPMMAPGGRRPGQPPRATVKRSGPAAWSPSAPGRDRPRARGARPPASFSPAPREGAAPQATAAQPPDTETPAPAPAMALVPDAAPTAVPGAATRPNAAILPLADRQACPRGSVPRPPEAEAVDCSVFAPPQVPAGQHFLLQAFVHAGTEAGANAARAQAQEADAAATRRAGVALPMDVARGSRIDLHLEWPGLQVHGPDVALVWRGRTLAAPFEVAVPADAPAAPALGRLRLAVDGVPAGVLRFQVVVRPLAPAAAPAPAMPTQPLDARPTRFRRAFVSYSSKDRGEVLRRVQAFRMAGLEVWQDVLDLDPGERWARGLWQAIDACDVFLLFWSTAAQQSEWVGREIDRALARKGGQADADVPPAIQPVPIEGPPIPQPPPALGQLHFNDALLAHIAVNPLR